MPKRAKRLRLRTAKNLQAAIRRIERGNANQRGYTYRWQRESRAFLASHPLCVIHERQGVVRASACVDHKVPHRGNQRLFWDRSNWQALCRECHNRKTGGGQ